MKTWGTFNMAMQLSWTLLFSLVIPLLGGIWLDNRAGTAPLFTLVGAVLGILAATVGVARAAIRMFSQVSSEQPDQEEGESAEEEPE